MSLMEQDHVLKEMECPVCLDVRGGCDIYVCKAGHQVCAPCHTSLPQPQLCPECRGHYDIPLRRNLAVERLIAGTESPVFCGYVDCKVMVQGVKMEEHMAECRHRMVPCPYCQSKIPLNSVSEHMKGHDGLSGKNNEEVTLDMDEYKDYTSYAWYSYVYEMHGQRFYLRCQYQDKIFTAWVVVEGGREEAARWCATTTVNGPEIKTICESGVFPIDMTAQEIFDTGNYLVMSEKQVKKFNTANKMPLKLGLVKE